MRRTRKKKAISLVSGVVALSRSGRKYADAEVASRAYEYRTKLNGALLEARLRLTAQEIPAFFANVARLTAFENTRFSKHQAGYTYLKHLQESEPRPLKFEIAWLAERARYSEGRINRFIEQKKAIEQTALRGDFDAASALLIQLEDEHGASLWSTSLRIALYQEIGGDEAQKSFVSELRKKHTKALLPYYLRHLSERAERSVPIGWYLENARRRIESFTDSGVKTYLVYKVLEEWPNSNAEVATVLRIEQNHHIFDIYETFVSALQHLANSSSDSRLRTRIVSALDRMAGIRDFRLEKLAIALGSSLEPKLCGNADEATSSALAAGNVAMAYRANLRAKQRSSRSGITSLLEALILSARRNLHRNSRSAHVGIERRAAAGLALRSTSARHREDIDHDAARKIGYVFSALSSGTAIKFIQGSLNANSADKHLQLLRTATQNSEHVSFLDVAANLSTPRVAAHFWSLLPESTAKQLAQIFLGDPIAAHPEVGSSAAQYAASCAAYHAGRYDAIEQMGEEALASPSAIIANASATIALSAHGANASYASAARLISTELSEKRRPPDSMPIAAVFKDVTWPDLSPHSDDIAMSNALAAFADIESSDKTRTIRTFALQKVLRKLNASLPSDLRETAKGHRRPEFIYFLYRACSTDVLDMLTSLTSSRAVLEERRDIYAALIELDPDNADEYRYQILSISKEIRVTQGLQTIDSSRVHVDISALRSVLRRDLADSFSRYLQLTKDGDTNSDSFDELLRDFSKPDLLAKHLLAAADSEADELLFLMIRQAMDRFLFNVPHGLDSYLSKRVRHGSIVGHLRAPAEAESMITQQHRDGRYKENHRWERAIAISKNPVELQKAFLSFSRSFDQHLLRLKDVLLHVRSDEKPLGLFDLRVQPLQYRLIRAVATQDRTLDTFLETILSSLRGLLNLSLQVASAYIVHESSKHIDELFRQLRATVQLQMPSSSERYELIAAVNRASTAVQTAVTSAANWFVPIELENVKFTMEDACEIALNSVKSISHGFDPSIEFNDESGLQFTVQELPFMQDVLFVALGNVAKHSNLSAPNVAIKTQYSAEKSLLTIKVVNDVLLEDGVEEIRAHLDEVKPKLRDPAYLERARTEGRSGMPKLASTVFQSEHGELDFNITHDQKFQLVFSLSVTAGR